jgi:hypothetical protein
MKREKGEKHKPMTLNAKRKKLRNGKKLYIAKCLKRSYLKSND